jgi:hypothetical protein
MIIPVGDGGSEIAGGIDVLSLVPLISLEV